MRQYLSPQSGRHKLRQAMIAAFVLFLILWLLNVFSALSFRSASLSSFVLSSITLLLGFFEGTSLLYLARERCSSLLQPSTKFQKAIYFIGLLLFALLNLAVFSHLMSPNEESVLELFIIGLSLGVAIGTASLIRVVLQR